MVYLYRNLLILRKKVDLTQAEIAVRLDVKAQTWSNYENGNTEPNLDSLIEISKIFGVTLDELVLSDFSNAQVMQEFEEKRIRKNAQVNAHPNAQLKGQKNPYPSAEDRPETLTKEGDDVGTWAVLGAIKGVDEKLDGLRLLVEKALKK